MDLFNEVPNVFRLIQSIPFEITFSQSDKVLGLLKRSDVSEQDIRVEFKSGGCSEKNWILGNFIENKYLGSSNHIPDFELNYVVTKFHWSEQISQEMWRELSSISQVSKLELIELLNNTIPKDWKEFPGSWEEELLNLLGNLDGIIEFDSLSKFTLPTYHQSLVLVVNSELYPIDTTWEKVLDRYGLNNDSGLSVKPIKGEVQYRYNDRTKAQLHKKLYPILIPRDIQIPDTNLIFYCGFNIALERIRKVS